MKHTNCFPSILRFLSVLFLLAGPALAQERVSYTSLVDGRSMVTEAVFHPVQAPGGVRTPAVVLVHSAGGWSDGTTTPLATALVAKGIAALELRVFETHRQIVPPDRIMPVFYSALKLLSERPDIDPQRIGIAGFSMGAHVSLWTSSQWMTAQFGEGRSFAAHAAVYPVCWPHTLMAKGEKPASGRLLPFPSTFLTEFTGAPVKVFAAGRDDYDDRDPHACAEFVQAIPEKYRASFELTVYPEATHGWNQKTQSFFERMACKGRGCQNNNVNNPEVTARSLLDLTSYFSAKLRP